MITKERLKQLEKAEAKLNALENGGVDNWNFYGEAMREYNEREEREEKLDALMVDIEEAMLEGVFEPSERGAGFSATEDAIENTKDIILKFVNEQK